MDALFQFSPAHYGIHRVAATLHFSEYRLRERDRSCGVFTPAECHTARIQRMAAIPGHALFAKPPVNSERMSERVGIQQAIVLKAVFPRSPLRRPA